MAGFREIKRTVYKGDGIVATGGSYVQEVVTNKALDFLQKQNFDFVKVNKLNLLSSGKIFPSIPNNDGFKQV